MKTPLLTKPVLVDPGDGEHVLVIGDQQTIKLGGMQTGGAIAIIEQTYRPGAGVPLHFHTQEDAVFYIMEGQMEFVVGNNKISAEKGSTVFLPRAVPHSSKAGDQGAVALVILSPAGGERMFRELDNLAANGLEFEQVAGVCRKYGIHFV